MRRFSTVTLLLNIFRMLDAQNQVTLYYQVITEQEAAESLHEIHHRQALPLVLHMETDSTKLLHSQFLTKLVTDKGRIINPTQFARKKPSRQFFFCPKENSIEKCLVYKEFRPMEPLQCAEEAIPIVKPMDGTQMCGFERAGILHILFYEICPDQEPYNFINREIIIYEFCYDANQQKILHTNNLILHPKLVNSKVLQREREIQYDVGSMDGFILRNQSAVEAAIAKQLKPNEPNSAGQLRQKKKLKTGKFPYKAQKLIPAEDMAFALWRKPTFQYLNIRLQHEKLIDLWNEINHYIRLAAEKIYVSEGIFAHVSTGVFDLDSKLRDDSQMPNMWVKMIYFLIYDDKDLRGSIRNVIIILMNNFVDTTADHGASSQKMMIDDYCGKDFCAESLKKKFDEVGGQIRCCSMNAKSADLFGGNEFLFDAKILPIPGVTGIIE